MYDVAIVGGGPIGLYSAELCRRYGLSYVVLEEHNEIGKPNHCSGLISTRLKNFVKFDRNFIEHEIRACVLHSKNISVKLEKRETAAYVIDRERFDKTLSKGKNIKFNTRVAGFSRESGKIRIHTNKGDFEAKVLLACDGANSVIRKKLGIRPKETLIGIIAIKKKKNTEDFVELWFDKSSLDDGFYWKIPRGRREEYGMLGKYANFKQLEDFFGIKEYDKRAGVISLGIIKTYSDRILLVGDAACQVKPWSGGGVVYGLKSAEIAIKTIREAFKKNDFSEEFLGRYDKEWKRTMGKQIRMGMLYRKLYKKINNREIDFIFSLMKRMKFISKLDMDML